jgi:hypothetical protein
VFGLAVAPLFEEGETVTIYDSSFAVFMSSVASIIGPANAIPSIPPDLLERAIVAWARGLKYVSGRTDLENAVDGAVKILTQGTLAGDLWFELFAGTVAMMERSGRAFHERLELDIAAIREEEENAKQFDSSFSKLRFADLPCDELHPELHGANITQYMVVNLAQFSHARPGLIPQAVAQLPQPLRSAFERYPSLYDVSFV